MGETASHHATSYHITLNQTTDRKEEDVKNDRTTFEKIK